MCCSKHESRRLAYTKADKWLLTLGSFPAELTNYGLSENLLEDCLKECISEPGKQPLWHLSYAPTIGFQVLHHFLDQIKLNG